MRARRDDPMDMQVAVVAEDVQVAAKPRRRTYTAEYKRRILKEADACTAAGGVVLLAPGDVAPRAGAGRAGRPGPEEARPHADPGRSPRPEDHRARAAAGRDDRAGGTGRGSGGRPKKLGGAARPAGGDRAVMIAL